MQTKKDGNRWVLKAFLAGACSAAAAALGNWLGAPVWVLVTTVLGGAATGVFVGSSIEGDA